MFVSEEAVGPQVLHELGRLRDGRVVVDDLVPLVVRFVGQHLHHLLGAGGYGTPEIPEDGVGEEGEPLVVVALAAHGAGVVVEAAAHPIDLFFGSLISLPSSESRPHVQNGSLALVEGVLEGHAILLHVPVLDALQGSLLSQRAAVGGEETALQIHAKS